MTRLPSWCAFRVVLLPSLLLLANGCDSDSTIMIADPPEDPADVIYQSPTRDETRVDLDEEIYILFERLLSQDEIAAATFTVNEEAVAEVVHEPGETASRLILVPATPLEYHHYYDVEINPGETSGLPAMSWSFATDSGPAGLLWERADFPQPIDLWDVASTLSGFLAVGEGGAVIGSPLPFAWRESVGDVGEHGVGQSEDLVWVWPGSRGAALTATGVVYVGSGVGDWMQRWDPPENLFVKSMWGITTVLVGSLRDQPNSGFLSSSYPGDLTLTGAGRVMRAAGQGYDTENFFLAVGDEGSVFFTRDRIVWEDVNHRPDWGDFRTVVVGYPGASEESQVPRVTVAAGDNLAWSEDGREWQLAAAPETGFLYDLSWGGYPVREYLAVGENAAILHSFDGKSWERVDTGVDLGGADLHAASTGPFRWVVVGEDGVTLISPPNALGF